MIYQRSFYAETLQNVAVLCFIFGGLLALVGVARIIGDNPELPAAATLGLVLLQLIKVAPQLLTATFFAALVMVFGRMCHSGEMIAWKIAGLRDAHWVALVVKLAVPMAITVGILAMYSVPWSLRYAEDYLHRVTQTLRLEDSTPSLFGEVAARDLVYHLDKLSPDREAALGVFIQRSIIPGEVQIIRAASAQTQTDLAGLRAIDLANGQVHDLDFNLFASSRTTFVEARLHLGQQWQTDKPRLRAMTLADLNEEASGATEFWWRLAFIPVVLMFALVALPLAKVKISGGAGYLATLALLSYWLYYAIAGLSKDYGIKGELPAVVAGMLPLGLLLGLGAIVTIATWNNRSWR